MIQLQISKHRVLVDPDGANQVMGQTQTIVLPQALDVQRLDFASPEVKEASPEVKEVPPRLVSAIDSYIHT